MLDEKIIEFVKKHESLRLHVYKDTKGNDTIGWGHLLKHYESFTDGISEDRASALLQADLLVAYSDARYLISNFDNLNLPRQAVVVDMAFNLGTKKFSPFKKTIAAIEKEDFICAANEMKNSEWYNQVKSRGVENCNIMRRGSWL